jgi:hypothetical protein
MFRRVAGAIPQLTRSSLVNSYAAPAQDRMQSQGALSPRFGVERPGYPYRRIKQDESGSSRIKQD